MTDNLWSDILILVLFGVVGGMIVATIFELIPDKPSRARRAILAAYWLVFCSVAPVVIVYLIREVNVLIVVVVLVVIAGIIFLPLAHKVKEEEKKNE